MSVLKKLGVALICGVSIAACGGGGGSGGPGDERADQSSKIINGTEMSQADLPQYVKVLKQYLDGSWGGCTGTMISARAVLTAAHCVVEAQALGVQTDGEDGPVHWAEQVYMGQGYGTDPNNIAYSDIAIIITQTPTGRPPLALLASTIPAPGDTVTVIGFGVDDAVDGVFGTLRMGTMKVASASSEYIVVEYDGDSSNVCFGDSGGPAVFFVEDAAGNVGAAIAGVVSAGTSSLCAEGDMTYYVNVQPYLNGILAIVPDAALL